MKQDKKYNNVDFARDLKKAHMKPAKKASGKKKKDASFGLSKTGGAYVRNYKGFGKPDSGPTIAKAMANGSGKFEPGADGGQYNINTSTNPGSGSMAGNIAAKKSKKSKGKTTKKKVSHVLQESSMCKECKTSHVKGKHMQSSGVKKKR